MNRKYLLGVAHTDGEENKTLGVLREYFSPGDIVAIELEPLVAKVVQSTIRETLNNPEKLKEILTDCGVPFNFYWGNLMRLSVLNNLQIKFLPLENRQLIDKATPLLNEYLEKGLETLGKKKIDIFIQNYVLDREKYFGSMIKSRKPAGIIVGSNHVDYFLSNFPEYNLIYNCEKDFSFEDYLGQRINVLRQKEFNSETL